MAKIAAVNVLARISCQFG